MDMEGGTGKGFEVLWREAEFEILRGISPLDNGHDRPVLLVVASSPASPAPGFSQRLAHEHGFRHNLNAQWAVLPFALADEGGLYLEDPGGALLANLVGHEMPLERFLRLALGLAHAVGQMHADGVLHKSLDPGKVFVDEALGKARLSGFGNASRASREAAPQAPAEGLAGWACMAPEQTGRMNLPVDTRSDLYSLGMTLYQVLTGSLPFRAADAAEWAHCHLASMPEAPSRWRTDVPAQVSAVLMKLLSKAAEDRYQTAAGLCADLQACLDDWLALGNVARFPLGRHDARAQLQFAGRLQGRDAELEQLRQAYARVSQEGKRAIVLLSGYAGIGKSALLLEFQRSVLPAHAVFVGGKYDQYKRDIPYATLAQTLRTLLLELLARPDDELAHWRESLSAALGHHGQVLVGVVPEIELLLGPQPPLPGLSDSETRHRLRQLFCRCIALFARAEHPLVLFLDDLQWLDMDSLDLFEDLAVHAELRHLLLVGAYRDNEVGDGQALRSVLARLEDRGATALRLAGLAPSDLAALLAEALNHPRHAVGPLANCVAHKTGGNPFFAEQFLAALMEDGLLLFDAGRSRWHWDLQRVEERQVTDNIVDLLIERLRRLPPSTLDVLQTLACMGHRVDQQRLSLVLAGTPQEVRDALLDALRVGLLIDVQGGYAFAHDRVHEAVYGTLSPLQCARLHGRVGRALHAAADEQALDAQLFEIVNHLNRGTSADDGPERRRTNARLNLQAGRKARSSGAYAAACGHFALGLSQLEPLEKDAPAAGGEPQLSFKLGLEYAECSFLAGELARTRELVDRLPSLTTQAQDTAAVHRLRIELHVVRGEHEEAVRYGLVALRQQGIELPFHPSMELVQQAYASVWSHWQGRPLEDIAGLPPMQDPRTLAAMRLLAELWAPAYCTEFNFGVTLVCKMAELSLLHGVAPASAMCFATLGWLMGPVFSRFEEGYRLARLACAMADQHGSAWDVGRSCIHLANTATWIEPMAVSEGWYGLARRKSLEAGDLFHACYFDHLIASLQCLRGKYLPEVVRQARASLPFINEIGFTDAAALVHCVERPMSCLMGQTHGLSDYSDGEFDGLAFEQAVTDSRWSVLVQWYWMRKTVLFYLAGDPAAALAAAARVPMGPLTRIVQVELIEYLFFTSLAICAHLRNVTAQDTGALRDRLAEHAQQIERCAKDTASPMFVVRHLLLAAEMASLEGRLLDAERLFEQGAHAAREDSCLPMQALACELASRFWDSRGFERIARAYLGDAIDCYGRWGAHGKVRQLATAHPEERGLTPAPPSTAAAAGAPAVAGGTSSLQARSSEQVTEQLITTLMRTVIQHAGAERAVLMRRHGQRLAIAAEASLVDHAIVATLNREGALLLGIPESVMRFVTRTGESIVVDDARQDGRFARDPHITQHQVRSMLCLPIEEEGEVKSLLYLENRLAAQVFTKDHLDVLRLLASQAAISLENARLFADLEARDYKIRRLFEVDVIGIVFWALSGHLLDANDAFLRMVGYSRDDLLGGMHWFDMTPPEWQDQVLREVEELNETGALRPVEKEYFRKDGSRLPVLIGAATFEGTQLQGVAVIVDLSQQKEAEARALAAERGNRELREELAHTDRLLTMGYLSAWIAHDVKQPLAGLVASANAGLQWLAAEPPNLAAAERAVERVVRDGMRAAEVLARTRSLVAPAVARAQSVDINAVIVETLTLVAADAERHGIALRSALPASPLHAAADRTQIQQVLLNLLLNAVEAMVADDPGQARELQVTGRSDPGGGILVEVLDTGPGVAPDKAIACFHTFYTTKRTGLGMGLAICRSIIESFGGSIACAANSPRGAVFRFELHTAHEPARMARAPDPGEV